MNGLPPRRAPAGVWSHSFSRLASRDRSRGLVLLWTLLFLTVFVGFVGLMIDQAYVSLVAHQLQNTADAASLAAAQQVLTDQDAARTLAVSVAFANRAGGVSMQLDLNGGNTPTGDIVLGRFNRSSRTFTPDTGTPNAVKVIARRTTGSLNGALPLIFGPAFGATTSEVARASIAIAESGGGNAGIIVLDPSLACTLQLSGTPATISVTDTSTSPPQPGAIQVNSNNACAACTSGHPTIAAGYLNVTGNACIGGANFEGELTPGAPVIPDPLSALSAPPTPWAPVRTSPGKRNNVTIPPGYYPGGFDRNGGTLTLQAGLYVLGGSGMNLTGQAAVVGTSGVMIYLPPGSSGIDMTGQSSLQLAPIAGGDYDGITIFQDRANTHEARIVGNGFINLSGTLYFPSNRAEFGGNGGAIGNQVIADTLWLHGNGNMTLAYDGSESAGPPVIFLVE